MGEPPDQKKAPFTAATVRGAALNRREGSNTSKPKERPLAVKRGRACHAYGAFIAWPTWLRLPRGGVA